MQTLSASSQIKRPRAPHMDLLKAQTKTLPGGDGPGADMVKVVEQATADAIAEQLGMQLGRLDVEPQRP